MITQSLRLTALAAFVLSACTPTDLIKPAAHEPMVTAISAQNLQLRSMPRPTQRIPVAVYGMPDLTGQYRERENTQSLSRAVSQGGGPMLISALQAAGEQRWFSVLDRTNLDDLLRERQIVTEMRRLYRDEDRPNPNAIPPLRHAGIIIQGAIVGYDSNTMTGGFGARYLGIGGDTQWKLDIVTVSLRAVATSTGEVLASTMVEKPIASTSVRGGVFSYVELDRLLEVETGMAANEPKQLALQMAIEKAVASLILEGADVGIWSFADRAAGDRLLRAYRAEKYRGTTISPDAPRTAPPDARTAARVVPTRPVARPQPAAVQERPLPPAQQAPSPAQPSAPPPPPASDGEVAG